MDKRKRDSDCSCKNPEKEGFMICCDSCDVWHYGKSVGISLPESKKLEKWFCSPCSSQRSHWKKLADELKQKIDEVKVVNDKAFMELRAEFKMGKEMLQDDYDNIAKTLEEKQKDIINLKQKITLQEASRLDFEENQNKQELIQNLIVALCQKFREEFDQTSALKKKLKSIEAENKVIKEKLQSFVRKSKLSLKGGSRAGTQSQT